ncbi:MAG: hypothetical protein GC160_03010 [Acidobacteria bacterium]|nr:hypothetical protein [Acidobacteriota bacterium]
MPHGHFLRLALLLCLLALPAAAQRSRIPLEQTAGGTAGDLCFKDDAGSEVCWSMPDGTFGSGRWILPPSDIGGGGCLTTDGSRTVTVSACSGGSGSAGSDGAVQLSDGMGGFRTALMILDDVTPLLYVSASQSFGTLSGRYFQGLDSGANTRKFLSVDANDKLHLGLENAVGTGTVVLHTLGNTIELPDSFVPPDAAGNNFLKFNSSGKATWDAIAGVDVSNTLSGLTPRGTINFDQSLLATDNVTRIDVKIDPAGITTYTRAQGFEGGTRGKVGGGGSDNDDLGAGLDSGASYSRTPFRRAFVREYVQALQTVWAPATTDISSSPLYWRAGYIGSGVYGLSWERNGVQLAYWDGNGFEFYKDVKALSGASVVHTATTTDLSTQLTTRLQKQASSTSGDAIKLEDVFGTVYLSAGYNSGGVGNGGVLTVQRAGLETVGIWSTGSDATRGLYVGVTGSSSTNRVVGPRLSAVADVSGTAGGTYTSTEQSLLNSVKTQLNLVLSRLRTHGLIAP